MSPNLENAAASSSSPSSSSDAIDQAKLQEFLGKIMTDVGGAMSADLVNIGDRLGLYKAMANAEGSSMTAEDLAQHTGVSERCVREWLANQAAGGYIVYDSTTKKYSLPKEHALALADENSPVCSLGTFQVTRMF